MGNLAPNLRKLVRSHIHFKCKRARLLRTDTRVDNNKVKVIIVAKLSLYRQTEVVAKLVEDSAADEIKLFTMINN
jgi:hypothetical protein